VEAGRPRASAPSSARIRESFAQSDTRWFARRAGEIVLPPDDSEAQTRYLNRADARRSRADEP
jgi:hypothetical protein